MGFRHDPLHRDGVRLVEGGGDVLLLSMRRIHDLVAFALPYELEDVIAEVTGADRVEPAAEAALELSRRMYKLFRYTSRSERLAGALALPPPTVRLSRDYQLFLPVFNHPHELYALASVPGWRDRCRKAACFVSELWGDELPRYLIELLAQFDHVFVGTRSGIQKVSDMLGRPCSYLPLAVDVVRFSPFPDFPERVIDVCNIGRRSASTHQALLELARQRRIFYFHDTVAASGKGAKQRTFHIEDPATHRQLLANLLRRSRTFIANRSRANEPEYTKGRDEISSRYYEGAAAGTVMLGDAPRTEEFRRQFDWPDAVVHMPFDAPQAARLLEELEADPARIERIGRENARHAALRHDWVYRLGTIFETLGLSPTEGMKSRAAALQAIAAGVDGAAPSHPGRELGAR